MNHLEQLSRRLHSYLFSLITAQSLVIIVVYWLLENYTKLDNRLIAGSCLLLAVLLGRLVTQLAGNFVLQPIKTLWQAILHLNPATQGGATPDIEKLRIGRELVTNLMHQIYQLASVAEHAATEAHLQTTDLHYNFIAQNLPLPLLIMDSSETIKFANPAAADYIGIAADDMVGKNVYMVLDMSFPNEATFASWLKQVRTERATAHMNWERVRLNIRDNHPPRLFDLAAFYNRDNLESNETMLVLFDHTEQYSQEEQAVSFIALGVHELRTPLTLLRGYIEVFEEELGPQLSDPELNSFMLKMHAQAEQLTAFVNNILNVARVDADQLELRLQPEDWSTTLKSSIAVMSLRAKVRGITLHCRIIRDLPPVGVDRLSIGEVISNLIDNAIKYSGNSKLIEIETHLNADGLIETTVQDFGLGIPTSILPNLFTKFYRDHRNRAQVGGTGLGLYLSKAIIGAHGGNIWVHSKENQGSTFGFTLLPYTRVTETMKQNDNQEIIQGAHGWIKNHSFYRR